MTKDEIKQTLKRIKQRVPGYFKTMTDEDKLNLIDNWFIEFSEVPKEIINLAISLHFKEKRMAPQTDEVRRNIPGAWKLYWLDRFPGSDTIYYNDKFIDSVDWETIPTEVQERMKYRPDPNDERRNALLKEALDMQKKFRQRAVIEN